MANIDSTAGGRYPPIELGKRAGPGRLHTLRYAFSVATVSDEDDLRLTIPVPKRETWLLQFLHVEADKDFAGVKVEVLRTSDTNALDPDSWSGHTAQTIELGQQVVAGDAYDFAPPGGEPYTDRDPPLADLLDELLFASDKLRVTLDDADFALGGTVALVFVLTVVRFGAKGAAGGGGTPVKGAGGE